MIPNKKSKMMPITIKFRESQLKFLYYHGNKSTIYDNPNIIVRKLVDYAMDNGIEKIIPDFYKK